MNLFTDIPMPDPSTIKRLTLILFLVLTVGVKLFEVMARKTRSR